MITEIMGYSTFKYLLKTHYDPSSVPGARDIIMTNQVISRYAMLINEVVSFVSIM